MMDTPWLESPLEDLSSSSSSSPSITKDRLEDDEEEEAAEALANPIAFALDDPFALAARPEDEPERERMLLPKTLSFFERSPSMFFLPVAMVAP